MYMYVEPEIMKTNGSEMPIMVYKNGTGYVWPTFC